MNLPEALLEDLSGTPGFERSAFLEAHRQTPPVSVRLHPQKWPAGTQNTFAGKVPWSPQGGYLEQRPLFALDPLWHGGAYYVQEASSMLAGWAVTQLFPDRSGLRVLDLCAAPGGKSTHIASLLPSDALLVSNEVIRSRAGILEENAIRWGAPNHWVSSNDPAAFGRLKNYFDLIVVDAPCSGSGLFRKDPDAQNEWSTEAVNRCAARQQRILPPARSAVTKKRERKERKRIKAGKTRVLKTRKRAYLLRHRFWEVSRNRSPDTSSTLSTPKPH